MILERVLGRLPLVLDQRARERYFEDGFLTVPGYVGAAWLHRLRAVVAAKVEQSRALGASDHQFDLAPDHSADKPNIRRLRKVDLQPELRGADYPRNSSQVSSQAWVVSASDATSIRSSLPWKRAAIASAVNARENRPKP